MATLDELISDCRSELNEPSSTGHVSNYELANFANHGQRLMALRIMEADPNFFEQSDQSLGFIADQEEYNLPGLLENRRITKLTRTDLTDRQPIDYIDFRKRDHFEPTGLYASGQSNEGRYYYLRGNKIGLKPTPKSTVSANILIHYLQPPHDLLWAQVDSQSTTTFIIPTSTTATPPYRKAGIVSTVPNYYVNAKIRILTGTDRGLERTITAYNVATRLVTIDSAWTTANTDDQDFVILSSIPDDYHEGIYQYMLMKAAKKKKDQVTYQQAKDEFTNILKTLVETVAPRHFDGPPVYIEPPADFDI